LEDLNDDFKILIVEDEFLVSADLKYLLESMNYKVVGIASNGVDAIRMAGKTVPDMLLVDMTLKGNIDGIDTAKQIYNQYNIPVVYLTSFYDNDLIERAEITQPYGYIIKPLDYQELHKVIEMTEYTHQIEQRSGKTTEIRNWSK
jgi:two-component system, response regulator PdtaR